MIQELFPIQFVEGINFGEEYSESTFLDLKNYRAVAIKYKPSLSYLLSKIEILTANDSDNTERKLKISIMPEYKEQPSEPVLSEGELIKKLLNNTRGINIKTWWQEGTFKQNIVIRKQVLYWIVIYPNNNGFRLCRALDGTTADILTFDCDKQRWLIESISKDWKIMMRFYGMILPL